MNIILTNNPTVKAKITSSMIEHIYCDGLSYSEVLYKARDLVHLGHRLLTHPIVGSVKPNEMPYKTVVLSGTPSSLDLESITLMEQAIGLTEHFVRFSGRRITPKIDLDFQMVDFDLIYNAIRHIL